MLLPIDTTLSDIWPTKACTAASSTVRNSRRCSSSGINAPAGTRHALPATCITLSRPGLCAGPSISVPPAMPSQPTSATSTALPRALRAKTDTRPLTGK